MILPNFLFEKTKSKGPSLLFWGLWIDVIWPGLFFLVNHLSKSDWIWRYLRDFSVSKPHKEQPLPVLSAWLYSTLTILQCKLNKSFFFFNWALISDMNNLFDFWNEKAFWLHFGNTSEDELEWYQPTMSPRDSHFIRHLIYPNLSLLVEVSWSIRKVLYIKTLYFTL